MHKLTSGLLRCVIFTLARLVLSLATLLGNCEPSPLPHRHSAQPYQPCPNIPQWSTTLIHPSRYLLEHGLKADGRLDPEAKDIGEAGSFETFFTETGNGKYVPRSIFVDLDPSVSDALIEGFKSATTDILLAH